METMQTPAMQATTVPGGAGDGRFGRLTDAPASLVLRGVRIIDPAAGTEEVRDLAVLNGLLVDPGSVPAGVPRLDAAGLVAAPGLCDLHTHLREPGGEGAETIESGTRAAAHGGFTTVCAMPNTDPPLDEAARAAWVSGLARDASARVRVVAAVTRGRAGEALTDAAELAGVGVVGFSDDGAAIPTARLARAALQALLPLDLPIVEHAEDPSLAAGTLMRAGPVATRLGLPGWPASAELTIVERDLALAEETGGRLHLTHLSTALSLEAVRRAKARGVRVTCDVTPHHLALTDAWVAGDRTFSWEEPGPLAADPFRTPLGAATAYDGRCRVNPPLTTRADALALLRGVADGTVDAIATDHAPHPPERTDIELGGAAPGLIGLEMALSLGIAAVDAGCLTLGQLLAALSTRPAALIGEARGLADGALAELVVFDPAARWRVEPAALASRSANTPLLGRELPGIVRLTLAGGRATWDGIGIGGA
jgi:dihydroorotase